jgi:hypothetical protein
MYFLSDGTLKSFYMRFVVNRQIIPMAVESQIILHNLKEQTRDSLAQSGQKVRLDVGWQNYPARTIFTGDLMGVVTVRNRASLITTLHCRCGADILANVTVNPPITAKPGTRVSSLVSQLVAMWTGIKPDASRLIIDPAPPAKPEVIGPGGWSFAGTVAQAIQQLADNHGFSWTLQNGTFQACRNDSSTERAFTLSAANGTLISAVPILTGPTLVSTGVEMRAVLVPDLMPMDLLVLQSQVSSSLNKTYRISEVSYQGSPNENEWQMLVRCMFFQQPGGG